MPKIMKTHVGESCIPGDPMKRMGEVSRVDGPAVSPIEDDVGIRPSLPEHQASLGLLEALALQSAMASGARVIEGEAVEEVRGELVAAS